MVGDFGGSPGGGEENSKDLSLGSIYISDSPAKRVY